MVLTCPIHQGLIHQGEHLTKRRAQWVARREVAVGWCLRWGKASWNRLMRSRFSRPRLLNAQNSYAAYSAVSALLDVLLESEGVYV